MKTKISFAALAVAMMCVFSNANAQTPCFNWVNNLGGNNGYFDQTAVDTATDAAGNVYVTGNTFNSPMTFGNTILNAANPNDIYLAKFDPQGNLIWVQSAGGSQADGCTGICTDINGNVFIT